MESISNAPSNESSSSSQGYSNAGPPRNPARAFILQANPLHFVLATELCSHDSDSWPANDIKLRVQVGDALVLWQSGLQAGVYGIAQCISEPMAADREGNSWRLRVRHVFVPAKPILRHDLLTHALLGKNSAVLGRQLCIGAQLSLEQYHALIRIFDQPELAGGRGGIVKEKLGL